MIILAQSCPYQSDERHSFCNTSDLGLTKDEYYFNLFKNPAKVLYFWLLLENVKQQAYYKDVVFGFVFLIIFGGILYNANSLAVAANGESGEDADGIHKWIEATLGIGVIIEMSTLVFNFRSAFYVKA